MYYCVYPPIGNSLSTVAATIPRRKFKFWVPDCSQPSFAESVGCLSPAVSSPTNLSASTISSRIGASLLRRSVGSRTRFNSDRTSSSWRATSANRSLGIVAQPQIEASSGVLQKYRKTPTHIASELLATRVFHLHSRAPIEFFPYSLQEIDVAIFAFGIACNSESVNTKASHRRV